MPEYVERMIKERDELQDKINKINSFYNGYIYESLSLEQKILLTKQQGAMEMYLHYLNLRIVNEQKYKSYNIIINSGKD